MSFRRALVTGGSDFIGSAVVRRLVRGGVEVLNFDKLTYAASPASLDPVSNRPNYAFVQGDVADPAGLGAAIQTHRPDAILHLAAESHVDRSITGAEDFIRTNVVGT